ncbi:MAG: O-methyltransferase [Planctomycetota bacterium]
MSPSRWTEVDAYFEGAFLPADRALDDALRASDEAGLPPHTISPTQGQFLQLLASSTGARSILEVGTLGGYSTIWLARAVGEGGRVVTLELEPKHATVARSNFERAEVSDRIELREGPASESLAQLVAEGAGPFDLVFIDADKPSNPIYFSRALELTAPGSLIVVDNVVRDGAVVDAESQDARVQGVRELVRMISAEPRVRATALQTVGSKGYDGFALASVVA